jgi:DNA-binding protein HU-beta
MLVMASFAFILPAQAMNKGELVDAIASDAGLRGIEKSQIKRGMVALASQTAAELEKGSVLVPYLGIFSVGHGIDNNCDGIINNPDDAATQGTCIEFYPDVKDDGAILSTYLENYLADAMNRHAAAQDHNASRSNTSSDAVTDSSCDVGKDGVVDRASITEPSAASMRDIYQTFDILAAFNNPVQVPEIQKYWSATLSKQMSSLCYSAEVSNAYVADIMSSFNSEAIRAQEIRKEIQDIKNKAIAAGGSGSGNDGLLKEAAYAAKLDLKVIQAILITASKIIHQEIALGEQMDLIGFGTFSISDRAARTGRNPQTGATMKVSAQNVAKFKAGKALADTVK